MNQSEADWYLPGNDGQPEGPYTKDHITQYLQTEELDLGTLCWSEGMPDWQPLTEVEEFREFAPREIVVESGMADAAQPGVDDIGEAFGKVVSAARRTAKAASCRLSIRQHEKRKQQILLTLGRLLYESGGELLLQPPYVEETERAKAEDEAIRQLRAQVEALGKPGQRSPKERDGRPRSGP